MTSLFFFALLSWIAFVPLFVATALILMMLYILAAVYFRLKLRELKQIHFERHIVKDLLFVGDSTDARLKLINHGSRSTPLLEIYDLLPPGLEVPSESFPHFAALKGGEENEFMYLITARARGAFEPSYVDAYVFDPFLLFAVRRRFPCSSKLNVYPRFQVLQAKAPRVFGVSELKYDKTPTKQKGMGTDFRGLREYQADDDFRFIYWKSMAKSPSFTPKTKEFDFEKNLHVIVALQTCESMGDGFLHRRRIDTAIEAVLALGYFTLYRNEGVTVIFHKNNTPMRIGPCRQLNDLRKIVAGLFDVQPQGNVGVNELAEVILKQIFMRSLILFIVDSSYPSFAAPGVLGALRARGHYVHVLILNSLKSAQAKVSGSMSPAVELLLNREKRNLEALVASCKASGVSFSECEPEDLMMITVESYLAIKRGGLILA